MPSLPEDDFDNPKQAYKNVKQKKKHEEPETRFEIPVEWVLKDDTYVDPEKLAEELAAIDAYR